MSRYGQNNYVKIYIALYGAPSRHKFKMISLAVTWILTAWPHHLHPYLCSLTLESVVKARY